LVKTAVQRVNMTHDVVYMSAWLSRAGRQRLSLSLHPWLASCHCQAIMQGQLTASQQLWHVNQSSIGCIMPVHVVLYVGLHDMSSHSIYAVNLIS